jgi:ubiquinone/menaquinone biosynthesis C-methylase UbiE
MSPGEDPADTFDVYAANYDSALMQGVSISGEDNSFSLVAVWRGPYVACESTDIQPRRLLDFGCGTGGSTPYFFPIDEPAAVDGVDDSVESLGVARSRHGGDRSTFELVSRSSNHRANSTWHSATECFITFPSMSALRRHLRFTGR